MAIPATYITDHLDTWSSAIKVKSSAGRGGGKKQEFYGTKKLRELVLELAVRGLLIPQEPDDELATILIKQLHSEKLRLIQDKSIRKRPSLPDVSDEEKFTHLPSGWEFVRLDVLGDWGAGATPSRRNPELYGGTIPWFKSGELTGDYIYESEEHVTEMALQKASLRYNKVGDVLVAMYGANIGNTSILGVPATTNQAVCACTPFSGVDKRFLLTLIDATKNRFIAMGAGGAQPNISREKIIRTVVALPPKNEQHRIVAKADELMALCDQLEQQQADSVRAHSTLVKTLLDALTVESERGQFAQAWQRIASHFDTLFTTESSVDQLKQTVLQLAVMGKLVEQNLGDVPASELLKGIAAEKAQLINEGSIKKQKPISPVTNTEFAFHIPTSWEWCRLGNVCLSSDSGWSPRCEPQARANEVEWAVLKVSAVSWGEFRPNEHKKLPAGMNARPEYEVKSGDFLLSRANTEDLVAKGVIVDQTPPRLMMSDKLVRFLISEKAFKRYINLVNASTASREYYKQNSSGTSSSMKNITRETMTNLPIPLAPLEEQYRIVAKVNELTTLCDRLKTRLRTAQTTQLHLADSLVEAAIR